MSNNLTATILMAVYHDKSFIKEAVDSLLPEVGNDIELLIIDDHSLDGSEEILKEFQAQTSKLNMIRNKQNQGLGYCLSLGTEKAKGKYIIRMDADDICIKGRIAKQISFLEENPEIDIVGGAAIEINEFGQPGLLRKRPTQHDEIAKVIWANPLIHATVAFRKDRILKVGNYNPKLRRRQDYDLWFRCLSAGLRFANLSEPLIYYRFSSNSHRKQGLKQAINQAKIGLKGCWMLKLPLWQYLAVTAPIFRAVFPPYLSHLIYRSLAFLDPRK